VSFQIVNLVMNYVLLNLWQTVLCLTSEITFTELPKTEAHNVCPETKQMSIMQPISSKVRELTFTCLVYLACFHLHICMSAGSINHG
jgi:hypothetical protein